MQVSLLRTTDGGEGKLAGTKKERNRNEEPLHKKVRICSRFHGLSFRGKEKDKKKAPFFVTVSCLSALKKRKVTGGHGSKRIRAVGSCHMSNKMVIDHTT